MPIWPDLSSLTVMTDQKNAEIIFVSWAIGFLYIRFPETVLETKLLRTLANLNPYFKKMHKLFLIFYDFRLKPRRSNLL